ncbi:hypothetical protein QLY40_10260 [Cronobacter sakazakii]|uniref:hypothetical protein n=1 Tax=Cronobacter sakazakii TaxID=28141 RepID=UPI00294B4241|nr:hypothetical protein [Cronobacter sakazakii]MDI7608817.1 hypothetical protein [Cronobacter sakazakii]MDI7614330.1 hypothetical protein [Cronobacter sakazakii]
MGFKIELSGGAVDVLHALFFRGALPPGDIPSKSGANELREAGLVHTHHTATPFGGEDYFTYLTAEGQKFAIQYLVETRFGEVKDKPSMEMLRGMQEAIADSLDDVKELCIGAYDLPEGKTPVIFLLDRYTAIGGKYTPTEIEKAVEHIKDIRLQADLSKSMAAASPFAVDKGKVFINSAVIGDGVSPAIRGVKLNADESGTQHAAGMSVGVRPEQVAFHAAEDDGLKRARIADIVSLYLTGEYAEYQQEMVDELIAVFDSCLASNENGRHSVDNLQQIMQQAATDAIRNALKPGGLLFGKH